MQKGEGRCLEKIKWVDQSDKMSLSRGLYDKNYNVNGNHDDYYDDNNDGEEDNDNQ